MPPTFRQVIWWRVSGELYIDLATNDAAQVIISLSDSASRPLQSRHARAVYALV